MHRRRFLAAAAAAPLLTTVPGLTGSPAGAKRELRVKYAVNVEIWWRDLPLLDRIRKTAEAGFPAIEFWPWQDKDLPAIAELTGELGLDVAQCLGWGFKPGLNDPANHDRFVEQIEAGCEAARQLRCPMMTVVAGDDVPGMTQEEMHAHVIAGLKRVAPIVEAADVTLILEPMNIRVDHRGHCLYGSEPTLRICDAVDSTHVKINWDLYHMQITEGDLCRRLREGVRHLGYLQVADNPGRNELGTGEVHWPRVFQEALDLGYDGYVGLECWPKDGVDKAIERVRAAGTF
jgi:hydroxypyruvate isomerase